MSMMWIGVGGLVLGAGTSLAGSNQAKKQAKSAQNQNQAQFDEQQAENWKRLMFNRGVTPTGATVNTRLPIWASVMRTPAADGRLTRQLVNRIPGGVTPTGLS